MSFISRFESSEEHSRLESNKEYSRLESIDSNKEPRIESNEEEKEEKNLGRAVDARPSTARAGFDSQVVLTVNPSEAELARGWGPGTGRNVKESCSDSEAGSYQRRTDFCAIQL